MTFTDQLELDRAIAAAENEARKHGATEAQIADLVAQFKTIADDKAAEDESRIIPE
jgi:hypothetical protein